jgi:glutaredoxin 3
VKSLFEKSKVNFKLIELDAVSDGADLQGELEKLTGRRTVPNVFVGGKSIGGSDDTLKLHDSGELLPKLERVGAISKKNLAPGTDRQEL